MIHIGELSDSQKGGIYSEIVGDTVLGTGAKY